MITERQKLLNTLEKSRYGECRCIMCKEHIVLALDSFDKNITLEFYNANH